MNGVAILAVPKNAMPRQICAAYKKQLFTAADLAKYLEETAADLANYLKGDESIVPMEQVLAELETIHRQATAKREASAKRKKK